MAAIGRSNKFCIIVSLFRLLRCWRDLDPTFRALLDVGVILFTACTVVPIPLRVVRRRRRRQLNVYRRSIAAGGRVGGIRRWVIPVRIGIRIGVGVRVGRIGVWI